MVPRYQFIVTRIRIAFNIASIFLVICRPSAQLSPHATSLAISCAWSSRTGFSKGQIIVVHMCSAVQCSAVQCSAVQCGSQLHYLLPGSWIAAYCSSENVLLLASASLSIAPVGQGARLRSMATELQSTANLDCCPRQSWSVCQSAVCPWDQGCRNASAGLAVLRTS